MAEGRAELERRATEALEHLGLTAFDGHLPGLPEYAARAVLDALGLTEETVWTDDGDPEVQRNTPAFSVSSDPYDPDPPEEFFREAGWKLKRRYVTEWEVLDD